MPLSSCVSSAVDESSSSAPVDEDVACDGGLLLSDCSEDSDASWKNRRLDENLESEAPLFACGAAREGGSVCKNGCLRLRNADV